MAERTRDPSRGPRNRHVCKAPLLAGSLLRSADSGIGRRILRSLKSGDHRDIVEMQLDPRAYSNADVFWRDWMCYNLLRKYPKLSLGINTAEAAMDSFRKSETLCLNTNARLVRPYDSPTTGLSAESFIFTAREKIWNLLGEFRWEDAEGYLGFSGGATTRQRRTHGDSYYKFLGKRDVTRHAALAGLCAIFSSPRWKRHMEDQFGADPFNWVDVVNGSRITTVPKNAKTDRVIAIEPCMNMYLQRGIGGVIRAALKRVRVDLDDQGRNQKLAYQASITDDLATIDLSAASDSISTELVRTLMPPSWFNAMDMVRSKFGTFPSGEVVEFQKFSSMGNGFTFELESLIFWALCSSVVDFYAGDGHRTVAVYGDDIIVDNRVSGTVIELLDYCGFKCNVEKSFEAGPFRESCGKHYFRGVDVTPIYISEPIATPYRYLWFANSVRRWSSRPVPGICDPRFYKTWQIACDEVPQRFRIVIPEGIGDGGLIGTFSEGLPVRRNGAWLVWNWVELPQTQRVSGDPAVLRALSSLQRRETRVNNYGMRVLSSGVPISAKPKWVHLLDIPVGSSRSLLEQVTVSGKKRKSVKLLTEILQWNDAGFWPVAGA